MHLLFDVTCNADMHVVTRAKIRTNTSTPRTHLASLKNKLYGATISCFPFGSVVVAQFSYTHRGTDKALRQVVDRVIAEG